MEQMATPIPTEEVKILDRIESISVNMNGWLKFLGIVNIVSGALTALSLVGIIIAWLPIWLGILLLQAGNRATNARLTNNRQELVVMMDKIRLYFIIQGVLIIVGLIVVVLGIFMFGAFFSTIMHSIPEY
ncbi:MAG: hypothetical protein Kow0042_08810 [Calditrichia bacterium]